MTDAGDATSIRPFDDDLVLVNLAVWESLESLRAFVYSSAHVEVLSQRREWFERMASAYMVLWWVEPGHIPTVAEALDRLERLRDGLDRPRPPSRSGRRSRPTCGRGHASGLDLVDRRGQLGRHDHRLVRGGHGAAGVDDVDPRLSLDSPGGRGRGIGLEGIARRRGPAGGCHWRNS